jgi:hypothetical protein
MSRKCAACHHESRREIDGAIIRDDNLTDIAARFEGVSESGLKRHKQNCILSMVVTGQARLQVKERIDLQAVALRVMNESGRLALLAEDKGQYGVAIRALDPYLRAAEFAAKVQGDSQTDFTRDPRMIEMMNSIWRVLEQYPEAKAALARELIQLMPPAPGGDSEKG